jgi:glyceraldehyde 3-phosphate dehydrogenase
MAIKVAINGFGRIGRCFARAAANGTEVEIVAINDLGDIKNLAYLLKYDTVYRAAPFDVSVEDGYIHIGNHKAKFVQEKDPTKLPWGELGVDVVVESTGLFTDFSKAEAHLKAGAKRVVISAPAKDGADEAGVTVSGVTVLMGVNEEKLQESKLSSNASCTTNAASPLIAILDAAIGVEKAVLSTTHGYTASQSLVDGPSKKDMKEGRAAAQNIVPTSTGAAIAVTQAYTQLKDKFDGISLRVPVPAGSIADVTFIAKRDTTKEEVNQILTDAAKSGAWAGVFSVTNEPLVSSDIIGSSFGSIADLGMTRVVDGNLVKVLAWYDNEMGYTYTLLKHVIAAGKLL